MEAKRSPKGKKVPKKNVFWSTKSQKGTKVLINSLIWRYKSQEGIKIQKVCLDCAGVYGSHLRPARKLHFLKIVPLIFCCFLQGAFFLHLFGAADAKASKSCPKRVRPKPRVVIFVLIWSHFSESAPCFSGSMPKTETSAQNDAKSPKSVVFWEVQCAIRTRRRSPNTLFPFCRFFEK